MYDWKPIAMWSSRGKTLARTGRLFWPVSRLVISFQPILTNSACSHIHQRRLVVARGRPGHGEGASDRGFEGDVEHYCES